MLYIFEKTDLLYDDFLKEVKPLLSDTRREKIRRLRLAKSKTSSAVVYLLLRLALMETYGINEVVEFDYCGNGKPVLKDHPQIHFNLSHTSDTAACVVADAAVGVDVQSITNVKDRVARRVLTDAEYNGFLTSPEPEKYFCEIWSIKESFLKKTGQGIAAELSEISAADIYDKMVIKGDGYFCCVNGSSVISRKPVDIRYIGGEDFGKLFE